MSWSVALIGTPEGVSKKLDAIGEQMTDGVSKQEFLEAKPFLQGLVSQIVGQNVKLNASGHATLSGSTKTYGSCSVSLDPFYGEFVQ